MKWTITRWGGRGGMAERAALSTRVTIWSELLHGGDGEAAWLREQRWAHASPYAAQTAGGTCSVTQEPTPEPGGNWEAVGGGAGLFKDQGTRVHLWLTHADAWHKPRRRCKIIVLQLEIKWKKFKAKRMKSENEKCFSGWKLHLIK